MVVFREFYGKLFELRFLVLDILVIVLIVIVIYFIRDIIVSILYMEYFVEIKESLNKINLRYVVYCMDKKVEYEENFVWFVDILRKER